MMTGNDRKRLDLNLDLNLDLERREADIPRELDLAELEAVEGGFLAEVAVGAGIAIAGFAVGAAVGVAAGVAIGVAISKG